ncbi:UNVERIFIED_CONTAM: hypothetical protein K2H54_062252, partial [Gekko kuhli]
MRLSVLSAWAEVSGHGLKRGGGLQADSEMTVPGSPLSYAAVESVAMQLAQKDSGVPRLPTSGSKKKASFSRDPQKTLS